MPGGASRHRQFATVTSTPCFDEGRRRVRGKSCGGRRREHAYPAAVGESLPFAVPRDARRDLAAHHRCSRFPAASERDIADVLGPDAEMPGQLTDQDVVEPPADPPPQVMLRGAAFQAASNSRSD